MNRRLGGDVSLNAPIRDDARFRRVAGLARRRRLCRPGIPARGERGIRQPQEGACRSALVCSTHASGASSRRAGSRRTRCTLEDLAAEFGVSRERVRQIGVRAFEKVQKSMKKRIVVMETPAPPPAH